MTLFYFVRHGQVDRHVNPIDPPLSSQGILEAHQVAAYLQDRPVAQIYTSPLQRARETAAHIASALGLPVTTESRLRERMNFGDLPGQTFEQFVGFGNNAAASVIICHPLVIRRAARGSGLRRLWRLSMLNCPRAKW